jgi:hypothetical protein
MLKKNPSCVLASLKGLNVRGEYASPLSLAAASLENAFEHREADAKTQRL